MAINFDALFGGFLTIIEFTVINWEKYNPRSDRKYSMWFRLENSIVAEPKFFGLTAAQKFVCICIFAEASKKAGAPASINVAWLAHQVELPEQEIIKTFQHLERSGVVVVSGGIPSVSGGGYTNERTNERTRRTNVCARNPATPDLTGKIWDAYRQAYAARYKTDPVRNAKVNTQIKQLGDRLGADAPDVVRFFLSHSKSFYVQKLHEIGLCLADAESLRTQWATNRKVTQREAQQADAQSALGDQLQRIRDGKL